MTRQALTGTALAVGAVVAFGLGGLVGPEVQTVALLGLAVGAAIGLVPDATPGRRAAAFALGVLAAWVGYLLRAVALPDATSGRLVAVVAVVVLCTVVALATAGRLPLWAALLGAGATAGAYETVYSVNPTAFLTTSPEQVSAVLLAAGLGFLATVLLEPSRSAAGEAVPAEPSAPAAPAPHATHATRTPGPAASRPLESVPEA